METRKICKKEKEKSVNQNFKKLLEITLEFIVQPPLGCTYGWQPVSLFLCTQLAQYLECI